MACVVRPCDALGRASGVVDEFATPLADDKHAVRSCCWALSEAIRRAQKGRASRLLQRIGDVMRSGENLPADGHVSSADVHRGITQAVDMLRMAAEEEAEERAIGEAAAPGRRLIATLIEADVPAHLVACLTSLDFEARKDAMWLFTSLLKHALTLGAEEPLLEYLVSHPRISRALLDGCASAAVFAHCAQMLRECARHPKLVVALLRDGAAFHLLDLAREHSFEISTEAFASVRALLLDRSDVSAPILADQLDAFVAYVHELLRPETDYVVRRQAFCLLGGMLADKGFWDVKQTYVAEDRYLQIHMNALLDEALAIRLGGFQVLMAFLKDPRKPYKVLGILRRNRARLLKILVALANTQANDSRQGLDLTEAIGILEALQPLPARGMSARKAEGASA